MAVSLRLGTLKTRSRHSAGRGESRTSPRRIAATEKQVQNLELRKRGLSYNVIAQKLGYKSPQAAYEAAMSALAKMLQEPAAEVRQLEIERLDALMVPLAPRLRRGDYQAIDRALKIMERRARLLGLDAPEKQEHRYPDGPPKEVLNVLVLIGRDPIARTAALALQRALEDGTRVSGGQAVEGVVVESAAFGLSER